ncbi:hypothetical protein ACHAXR_005401 [Thalassiosira sp. AJA248-18]
MTLTATGNLKAQRTSFADSDYSSQKGAGAGMPSIPEQFTEGDELNVSRRRIVLKKLRSTRKGLSEDEPNSSKHRSSANLLGAYSNMEKEAKQKAKKQGVHDTHHLDTVISDMIKERK